MTVENLCFFNNTVFLKVISCLASDFYVLELGLDFCLSPGF